MRFKVWQATWLWKRHRSITINTLTAFTHACRMRYFQFLFSFDLLIWKHIASENVLVMKQNWINQNLLKQWRRSSSVHFLVSGLLIISCCHAWKFHRKSFWPTIGNKQLPPHPDKPIETFCLSQLVVFGLTQKTRKK